MGCTPIPADQLFDVILGEAAEIVRKDYEGRIEALEAENERLRYHLEGTLETLLDAEVCSTDCVHCNEARAALGEK